MKKLHRIILRSLPGPFFATLLVVMFVLLMQFFFKNLKDLVGKGLELGIIAEFVAYSLFYMLVLAVPMSVLLMTIAAFGRLSTNGAYTAARNAGVSIIQMMWPVLVVGSLVMFGMLYFNNFTLPENNNRVRALGIDIRKKKPGFQLQEGRFYNGLRGYSIRANEIRDGSELEDIIILDFSGDKKKKAIIRAERGRLESRGLSAIDLHLQKGEMHRTANAVDGSYEVMSFDTYRFSLDLEEFGLERTNPNEISRTDRTMPSDQIWAKLDTLDHQVSERRERLRQMLLMLEDSDKIPTSNSGDGPASTIRSKMAQVNYQNTDFKVEDIRQLALSKARASKSEVDAQRNAIEWAQNRSVRYAVELHKKSSLALACLVFVLIGAPLGLRIRRGGLGSVLVLSIVTFTFYWVCLGYGEKLADRGLVSPWIGQWFANIIVAAIAIGLLIDNHYNFSARIFRRS